jgi:serine O-acetyltransferase
MTSAQEKKQRGAGQACIDSIISEINAHRSVSQQDRYRDGAAPELPSRVSIKSIVEDLISVLYPRHFGPTDLTGAGIAEYQRSTLITSLARLQRQIRFELQLDTHSEDVIRLDIGRRAYDIANNLAQDLPRIRQTLDRDIRAAFEGDPAAKSFDEIVFCYPGVAAVMRHRIAHQLYISGVPMIARIIAEIAHAETSIDIHPGATIDEGFFIDHGTGVVVGETTIVGKNVRLYQSVTLGAKRFEVDRDGALVKGQPRHPVIEDNVVIYAGATVLGRITIGKGSTIGGNIWLTHSVPPKSNVTQAKAHLEAFSDGGGI